MSKTNSTFPSLTTTSACSTMERIIFPVLVVLCISSVNGACENSWAAYKDEICIKSFTLLQTYDETKQFCSSQGDETSKASMVIVKESELQNFLTSYINGTFDNIWLGGRGNTNTGQFLWEDGDALTYTNWQEGHPKNITNADSCIELRPIGSKHSRNGEGKWADVPCLKRNLVMCQKSLSWSLGDAVSEIIRVRTQLEDELTSVRKHLNDTKKELTAVSKILNDTKKELEEVSSKVVPVGSIYIEYYNQPSPRSLWSSLTWQDITNTYAGLFFRAYGGDSESWGSTQSECAPRISAVHGEALMKDSYPDYITIPASGWSNFVWAGAFFNHGDRGNDAIRFYTTDCETRPKNKAIRIWKRTN